MNADKQWQLQNFMNLLNWNFSSWYERPVCKNVQRNGFLIDKIIKCEWSFGITLSIIPMSLPACTKTMTHIIIAQNEQLILSCQILFAFSLPFFFRFHFQFPSIHFSVLFSFSHIAQCSANHFISRKSIYFPIKVKLQNQHTLTWHFRTISKTAYRFKWIFKNPLSIFIVAFVSRISSRSNCGEFVEMSKSIGNQMPMMRKLKLFFPSVMLLFFFSSSSCSLFKSHW